MSWKISKQFNFAYGHRVWVQKLEKEFALDRKCVCRHLHGHEAEVHVHLEGDELDAQGMVTDFLHLSWLKKFFDETVDHKFIIDKNDPLYRKLVEENVRSHSGLRLVPVEVPGTDYVAGYVIDSGPHMDPNSPDWEYLESFFIVDFIPTSESLSKWVYDLATPKMAKLGVKVAEVEWWETPKSCSRYSG
jgi:6-pyruvoyltetrahydropterin/6-carboxytetrahydropterin synthase